MNLAGNTTILDSNVSYSLICLSHLRWDFVYQRPQHLLSRFARARQVFFFEEPIFSDEPTRLDVSRREDNLFVLVPRISNSDRDSRNVTDIEREMLDEFLRAEDIKDFVLWFYTPMALDYAAHLEPLATVFDCMDELSAFKFAPPELIENERKLLEKADLVFTGGQSLYEAKRDKHAKVFAFPSSIDVAHFKQARENLPELADQQNIPHPRFGFCGVIDERMDIGLLARAADLRPEWQFVMIGPIVKISDEDLPRRANIHYLGGKDYKELPAYISGWDIATMPFAMNDATRFISPTKTPEYLAAGKFVISTPIRDVVRPYGELNLVEIASTAEEFVAAGEKLLANEKGEWLERVDEFLAHISWDKTFGEMTRLIDEEIAGKPKAASRAV
ncbi:MAG TPA: glycosyltransferase family 1 protein [Pyrinomonadaceae bacterium]|jgi:UDP-galactopyranose mutase